MKLAASMVMAMVVSLAPGCAGHDADDIAPRAATIQLSRWWLHDGALDSPFHVDHRGEAMTHILRAEYFATHTARFLRPSTTALDGWREIELPTVVAPILNNAADSNDAVWLDDRANEHWLLSVFEPPVYAASEAHGLCFDGFRGVRHVYVNGQLAGQFGRRAPALWTHDPRVPAVWLAPSLLRFGEPNVVAVRVEAAPVSYRLESSEVVPVSEIPRRAAYGVMLSRAFAHGTVFMLLTVAALSLYGFWLRRRQRQLLYCALVSIGFAGVVWGYTVTWLPVSMATIIRVNTVALHLASCTSILLCLRLFNVQPQTSMAPRVWGWLCFVVLVAVFWPWDSTTWLLSMSLLPVALGGLCYCVVLNWRALKQGESDARITLVGLASLVSALTVDAAYCVVTGRTLVMLLPYGVIAFIGSVCGTLSRRLFRMHRVVQADLLSLNGTKLTQDEQLAAISDLSKTIDAVCSHLVGRITARREAARQQLSTLSRTRGTVNDLIDASGRAAEAAVGLVGHAEQSLNDTAQVVSKIAELADHSSRIARILDAIKDTAQKTDLLAVNAALEAVQAGASGHGIALVASRMQDLTESVMTEVKDIEEVTRDITVSTRASSWRADDARNVAEETTESARRIAEAVNRQQVSTQAVSAAMRAVVSVASSATTETDADSTKVRELNELVGRLKLLLSEVDSIHQQTRDVPSAPEGTPSQFNGT